MYFHTISICMSSYLTVFHSNPVPNSLSYNKWEVFRIQPERKGSVIVGRKGFHRWNQMKPTKPFNIFYPRISYENLTYKEIRTGEYKLQYEP